MRMREKLTLEEKFALALELIKRERSLDEIRLHYRVSHTTAYKIRNAFLAGGRAALNGERKTRRARDLEARVSALEALLDDGGAERGRKHTEGVDTAGVDVGSGGPLGQAGGQAGRR
jgi:hypothetical protein